MEEINAAIIGSGNIGSDLLVKIIRSKYIKCSLFVGRDLNSKGIIHAKKLGIKTSSESIEALEKESGKYDIIFDATSAEMHKQNSQRLSKLEKFVIDLTPAKTGKMCVPYMNLKECLKEKEINLVSCGGQATIPVAHVIKETYPDVKYIENVTSIASKSAGPATRQNIDEYVQTTQDAIRYFSSVDKTKVILNLNPADPPINMHNTTYVEVNDDIDLPLLNIKLKEMVKKIQSYVPGYNLFLGPLYKDGVITIMNEVVGLGDYLPKYAGNMDIMTCAALTVAEEYSKGMMKKR
ncbi:MAG TPA: acetaldehyde dehydrogenase (acetylating) [Candidatus Bilamarchaeaceae archaeon]|nr:acetaldehyde dehydrogenase (acetylating) [Candidatus Bilamarchaeaceae archaeon]